MHRMTMRSRVSDLYQEGSRFISSCAHILSQRPVFLLMTVSLKIALMSITPLSPEFVAFTHVTTANDITYTLSSGSFMVWSLMLRLIYGFWLVLPVEHPSVWNTIGFSDDNSSPRINSTGLPTENSAASRRHLYGTSDIQNPNTTQSVQT